MDQRTQFIADYRRATLTITGLCDLYGISRKTGCKWIDSYLQHGPVGLDEHSRRPWHSPNITRPEIIEAFFEVRRRHPSWCGKKILTVVHRRPPAGNLQAQQRKFNRFREEFDLA
jgi:putative transposase